MVFGLSCLCPRSSSGYESAGYAPSPLRKDGEARSCGPAGQTAEERDPKHQACLLPRSPVRTTQSTKQSISHRKWGSKHAAGSAGGRLKHMLGTLPFVSPVWLKESSILAVVLRPLTRIILAIAQGASSSFNITMHTLECGHWRRN